MNKTTAIAIAAVLILGIAVFLLSQKGDTEEMKSLAIPGVKVEEKKKEGDAAKEEEKKADETPEEEKATVGPADRIEITRKGTTIELKRVDEDSWRIVRPVVTPAEIYKVRGMLRSFDKPLASNYSRAVKAEALEKLGLDEANRIRVALYQGETALVDLFVGRVDQKNEGTGIEPDSMVMLPADLEKPVYYRIPAKDLRRAFDMELDELRSKKLFEFNKDAVSRIVVEDPRDKTHTRLVIEKKGGEGKDEWEMTEPRGVPVENLSGYVSSVANVRAERFLSTLPGADATALDKAYRITVTVAGEKGEESHTLSLGAGRKKGVYAQLEGSKEFFVVSTYTVDQLMKSFNDFRQKKLFSVQADDIEEIEIASPEQPAIHLRKAGGRWTFVQPAGMFAADAKIKSLASGLANFRVAEFLPETKPASETGLDASALRVAVTLGSAAGGGRFAFRVGKAFKDAKDQERFYAQLEGSDELLSVMRYSRDNVVKSPEDLKDTRLFRIEKEQVKAVTLTHPDQTLVFERTTADSKTSWKMTAPKVIEGTELTQLVGTLATLDVDSVAEGKTPAETGLTTDSVTVSFTLDDNTTLSLTLSEEVTDNKTYASSATEAEYAGKILLISKYKVDQLTKKLPDFEKK